ncbi:MAG: glycosyltransferase family 4 protein [bacterium]|nr:glycosyltransferase family 4 protein [bacterium]MDD3805234.1 glycosyltransferase family 4 protein [bacterium]MDD4152709.1 glycosyltransferase family 4 protein [bacterium]
MKTILFLDHVGVLGGGEVVLLNLIRGLDKARYHPVIALPPGLPAEQAAAAGADIVEFDLPGFFGLHKDEGGFISLAKAGRDYLLALNFLRRILSRVKPDILHTNSNKAHLLSRAAVSYGIPVIWHMHDLLLPEFFSRQQIKLLLYNARRYASRIIAVSQTVSKALIAEGLSAEHIRVIYNGCAAGEKNDMVSNAPVAFTQSERFNHIVGMVGRISPWKGQHIFLAAASRLKRKDILFPVIGGVLFGEDDYHRRIKEMALDSGLNEQVLFTGYLPDTALVYSSLDISVHASVLPEPFGLVVAESMLAGCPVIASDSGGPSEMINDGVDGLLFRTGDPVSLAERISWMLNHPDEAGAIGENGRRTALRRFTVDRMVADIERVYEEVSCLEDYDAGRCRIS